jgi:hypothetical protein
MIQETKVSLLCPYRSYLIDVTASRSLLDLAKTQKNWSTTICYKP